MQPTGEKGLRGKGRIKKERERTDFKSLGTTPKQKTIRYLMIAWRTLNVRG